MVNSGAYRFVDLVAIKDRIKKDDKIHSNVGASNAPKRFFGNFQKKKEGEANAIIGGWGNITQKHVLVPYQ